MAIFKFSNNFRTTLSSGINNSTTTIPLTSVSGLPSISVGEQYSLTIFDGTNIEEITVTDDASAPSLTATRNADGRGAFAFSAGAAVEMRPTSTQMNNVIQEVNDVQGQSITLTPSDIIDGASITTATVATGDKVLIQDVSDSDNVKTVTTQAIRDLAPGTGTLTSAQLAAALTDETGTGLAVFATSPTFTTPILGTPTSGTLTNCTGLPVGGGGTGRATATAYAPIFGGTSSTGAHQSGTAGTSGQLLQSGGASAVAGWTTATYPTTSSTSGKLLQSDGTNLVMSAATWPTAATNTKFIIGNGTNYVESTSTIPTSAGATANKHLKSDGTNYVLTTATISDTPSTAGKILVSDGTNWITSTPTFPNTSATTRKIIVSDGTNWTASTETYAVPGSTGNLLRSDGTNWTAAKATLTTDVTGVLPVANGGTNASSASITAFNNITGYTASGATGTTSTNLVFSTSPVLTTPTLGVASATSISFGDEALNKYDEGTWTPVFSFSTPGDLAVTGITATGRYTRIGRTVHINMALAWTPTWTTAAGVAQITGLPFTAAANCGLFVTNKTANITFVGSDTFLTSLITTTTISIRSYSSSTASTTLTTANFTSGASHTLILWGVYDI